MGEVFAGLPQAALGSGRFRSDDSIEYALHVVAMAGKRREERRVGIEPHGECQPQPTAVGHRQPLRLPIRLRLNAMLGVAQKPVGAAQFRHCAGIELLGPLQLGEGVEEAGFLHILESTAENELLHLHGELRIANAAGTEFHIFRPMPLGAKARLHLPHRLERAEVEIAPVHEGPQRIQQLPAPLRVARTRPRLDKRVALPTASLGLEVPLHRAEVHNQWAAGAVRPQTHVHAKHEAVDRDRMQQIDDSLADADKVLLVAHPR